MEPAASSFYPEEGDSWFLKHASKNLPDYMTYPGKASHSRRRLGVVKFGILIC
jgi:hypothetical protein